MLLCFGLFVHASAQDLDLPQTVVKDEAALAEAIPGLAKQVIANYRELDREKYLDNLFSLQIAADQYSDANSTLRSLRDILRTNNPYADRTCVQYEI